MKKPARGGLSEGQQIKAGATILTFPDPDPQHKRRRDWLRLVAATRDPATWALLHQHRARWAEYRRRCA
jgi:hypothetical protein